MDRTGDTVLIKISLYERGEIKGCTEHRRNSDNEQKIGFDRLIESPSWGIKNIIDDIVIVFKEHENSKQYIAYADVS
jgi:hypothetical protein